MGRPGRPKRTIIKNKKYEDSDSDSHVSSDVEDSDDDFVTVKKPKIEKDQNQSLNTSSDNKKEFNYDVISKIKELTTKYKEKILSGNEEQANKVKEKVVEVVANEKIKASANPKPKMKELTVTIEKFKKESEEQTKKEKSVEVVAKIGNEKVKAKEQANKVKEKTVEVVANEKIKAKEQANKMKEKAVEVVANDKIKAKKIIWEPPRSNRDNSSQRKSVNLPKIGIKVGLSRKSSKPLHSLNKN